MPKVCILPDRVANQIAAGEVIERPAAVVKELVENALDAGATRIGVEFAHAGQALIRVEDNGQGMGPEDARLALERHATSKIAEAADLDRLATFGFRGEALPSIASVSHFTLQTRALGEDAGTEIAVHGGRWVHERACGRPVGTRIEVEHLFEPVPARRKFLKSDRTEAAHIADCVRLYALACPAVSFALHEDGREIFRSPQCTRLSDRVAEIYGTQTAEGLLLLEASEGGMRLTGLVGPPGVSRGTRHDMVAFVNSRPVDSRTINGALAESYRELLPQGRHPVAFVFLEISPAEVDVNVHPAKREVRFRREAAVRSFVVRAVLERLHRASGTAAGRAPGGASGPLAPPVDLPAPFQTSAVAEGRVPYAAPASPASPVESAPMADPGPRWRFLGTAHGDYALFETAQGLVLLDRRAAHERVWYERLKDQFRRHGVPVQRLLLPVPLELNPLASAILTDNLAFLGEHGLEIQEFGRQFFRLEALPVWLEPGDAEEFVRDLVGALREGRIPPTQTELAREELARLAAAKAVRLPAVVGDLEALSLVRDLFATTSPLTSPAGRPTFVELNHSELARRFQK
ncbi:MAG TPA: DNA mismatch repair endonuclease MutL [Opitutaceae bacterium]|jgi:DNA mismatch repair protein MutL